MENMEIVTEKNHPPQQGPILLHIVICDSIYNSVFICDSVYLWTALFRVVNMSIVPYSPGHGIKSLINQYIVITYNSINHNNMIITGMTIKRGKSIDSRTARQVFQNNHKIAKSSS